MSYEDEQAIDETEQETALAIPPPLAWDKNGRRFAVPKAVWGWRVQRKLAGRGRPPGVFTANGPLHVERTATFEALAEAVGYQFGWYLLSGVDENSMLVRGCPTAHVQIVGPRQSQPSNNTGPSDSTIDHLCRTVQQLAMYSVQRDEAVCAALGQMTVALGDIQNSTANILRAAAGGMDIAAGVSLQKLPPPPEVPQLPPPPPQKNVLDFLVSPAGNTALKAVGEVISSFAKDD